jgi:carboxyl-terminal processing protease
MKNHIYNFLFLVSFVFAFQSCEVQEDNKVPEDIAINNFVWKGLNLYYLWQSDVANLADNRFANQSDLNAFLYGFPQPENLFQQLLNKPRSLYPNPGEAIDRFSVIFSDYNQLEGILSGTTKNNGAEFGLYYKDESQTSVFGVVRYVLPNSDAAAKNVQRGAIFYAINGTPLTKENYSALLSNDTYTMNFATYDDGNITPTGQSVSLTKSVISENPVYLTSVINSGAHKIGYLMYNGFYPNYESQLNAAFSNLKSQGITELVLDLRYNSGGSVATATRLASLITGQFTNQIFAKEQWNAKLEDYYNSTNPSTLLNLFTNKLGNNETLSSLNLNKVYILTTKSSASASELVINGLKPYINVVQIGDVTTGKNVGSVTLYDSPNFSKTNSSTKHRYAMQPIVLKIVNKVGFGDYVNGLEPTIELKEDFGNLGVLGDSDEPLLNLAINTIVGSGRPAPQNRIRNFDALQDNRTIARLKSEMYVDSKPFRP